MTLQNNFRSQMICFYHCYHEIIVIGQIEGESDSDYLSVILMISIEIPVSHGAVNPKSEEFRGVLDTLNSIQQSLREGNFAEVMIDSRKLITLERMEKISKEYRLKQNIRSELLRDYIKNAARVNDELIKCKESVIRDTPSSVMTSNEQHINKSTLLGYSDNRKIMYQNS